MGDYKLIIDISTEINNSLELNSSAADLIEKINDFDEDDIIIDFKDVSFISRAFAQAYYASKKRSPKDITEINMNDDIKPMMEMIEKQIML